MNRTEARQFQMVEASWREQCAVVFLLLWQMFGIFPVGRAGVLIYPLLNLLAFGLLLYFLVGLLEGGLSVSRRIVRALIVAATAFFLALIFVPQLAGTWARIEHGKTALIRPIASIYRFDDTRPLLLLSRDCGAFYRCALIANPSDQDPCDPNMLEGAKFDREIDFSEFTLANIMPTAAISTHYCSAIYKSKYMPWPGFFL
ncbi:hypothetical protein [Methylovirgula sp. 4M-Z18]|uniref:hypothetical protein n=1 Tax=Methylovirgula sp. 4M-Z18 TaxID=2293567 RepID=UPI0011C020F3|nr:hypothetical protein [Methylovirgula sp. 4M-Z18]